MVTFVAKASVRGNRSYSFSRRILEDGTDCFDVVDANGKLVERYQVK